MSIYSIIKHIYKTLMPKKLRHEIFLAMPLPLKKIRRRLIRVLEKSAEHDDIYDADFYDETREIYMAKSASVIARSIVEVFSPKSVVDVGCGTGTLLLALKEHEISCEGLEYSKAAIDICRARNLKVNQFDLEKDSVPASLKANVVISTEVAEHLPESCADHFVDTLCAIANTVIMSAAEPEPTSFGRDHVNEQPIKYWIAKFQSRGFNYDQHLSLLWCKKWKESGVCPCYYKTVMVFRHKHHKDTNPRFRLGRTDFVADPGFSPQCLLPS